MFHPIRPKTRRVILSAPIDYLSAGIEYYATPSDSGQYIRFDRTDYSCGTTIRDYTWKRAMALGILTILPLEA